MTETHAPRYGVEMPVFEKIRLLEGDDNRRFQFCQTGSPEDKKNARFKDRIEFGTEYVCSEDPRLKAHLKELGVKEPKRFDLNGDHLVVADRIREVIGDTKNIALLKSRKEKDQLKALDYFEDALDYRASVESQEKLYKMRRDSVLQVLKDEGSSLMVRIRAARVLDKKLYESFRSYDKEVDKEFHTLFFDSSQPLDLRLAILQTDFIGPSSAAYVIFNPLEERSLREESVYDSGGYLWSLVAQAIFDRLTDAHVPTEPFLKNAAIGTLILATGPLIPADEGTFSITGATEYTNAENAHEWLRVLGLTGDKLKGIDTPIKRFIARHLSPGWSVGKFLEKAAQVKERFASTE